MREHPHEYILDGLTVSALTSALISEHSAAAMQGRRDFPDIRPHTIEVNFASFNIPSAVIDFPMVSLSQEGNAMLLS